MRSVREQPRLVVAKAFWAVCLVVAGILIGGTLHDDGTDAVQASQLRLTSAQSSGRAQRAELQRTKAELELATAARARAERTSRALRRANHGLQRDLAAAKRPRHRSKRRP
jgi:hypothetical protein